MGLPDLNIRIKQIIDYETNGNINAFSRLINTSQQKLDRLFKADTRTGKIPSVPSEILVNITEYCVSVNPEWILSGSGGMIKTKRKEDIPSPKVEEKIFEKNEKYNKNYSLEYASSDTGRHILEEGEGQSCQLCNEKDRTIKAMQTALNKATEVIRTQAGWLKEKERLIEYLISKK